MNIPTINSLGQPAQPDVRAESAARKSLPPSETIQQKRQPSPQEVRQAVESINLALHGSKNTALQFTIDPDSRSTVVKVVDTESGELIRQFPSEAALAIAESIGNFQKSLLLGQEA